MKNKTFQNKSYFWIFAIFKNLRFKDFTNMVITAVHLRWHHTLICRQLDLIQSPLCTVLAETPLPVCYPIRALGQGFCLGETIFQQTHIREVYRGVVRVRYMVTTICVFSQTVKNTVRIMICQFS